MDHRTCYDEILAGLRSQVEELSKPVFDLKRRVPAALFYEEAASKGYGPDDCISLLAGHYACRNLSPRDVAVIVNTDLEQARHLPNRQLAAFVYATIEATGKQTEKLFSFGPLRRATVLKDHVAKFVVSEIDWKAEISQSRAPELMVYHMEPVLRCQSLVDGKAMNEWQKSCRSELSMNSAALSRASFIYTRSSLVLYDRVRTGQMTIHEGRKIAVLSREDQMNALKASSSGTSDPLTELKSRSSLMLDQKLGWQQDYTAEDLAKVRERSTPEEIEEITQCLSAVSTWCQQVCMKLQSPSQKELNIVRD